MHFQKIASIRATVFGSFFRDPPPAAARFPEKRRLARRLARLHIHIHHSLDNLRARDLASLDGVGKFGFQLI